MWLQNRVFNEPKKETKLRKGEFSPTRSTAKSLEQHEEVEEAVSSYQEGFYLFGGMDGSGDM